MTQWKRFEAALTAVLGALTAGQYLVIATRTGNRFVQFARQGGEGLQAEAASNRVLEANERHDPAALDRLDALGWNRPIHDISEDDEHDDGSCNHWFAYQPPVPFAVVADQAVRTLTEVFRVQHPNELVYRAFADGGPVVLLPTLGIEVDPTQPSRGWCCDQTLSSDDLSCQLFAALDAVFDGVEVDDGTVEVPFGPAMVFLQVCGDPPVIRVWSPVVAGVVDDGPLLLHEMNQRNTGARFVRFVTVDDTVIASYDLFGRPFVPDHVVHAVGVVGELADSIDDEFCDRFGGHAFFPRRDDDSS